MSRIISYRGKIGDGEQDTIPLHTNDGKTGYKIIKFQCMLTGFENAEMVIKIYKVKQTLPYGHTIDFEDLTLLAAALVSGSASAEIYPEDQTIIFDNEIFNQDIYITGDKNSTATDVNYYIELEQIDLTEDQALVAIVKNLRNEQ